ncbi:MAG: exonuclease domain-containing protein [Cellulophaga sp.]
MYAVLDIETTGGKYNEEGITEIAIHKFDGHEVVDTFISLINPEKEIQPFVVNLTGINNKMLRTAPKFHEVAKRIIEITKDTILIAHNAQFDYRILRTEFRRLGYNYEQKTLCTVELSKKLIPDKESYSLGKLVRSLGIPVTDRHRANGDALATLQLFKLLLSKDLEKSIIKTVVREKTHGELSIKQLDIIDQLPSETGVYYLHNKDGDIIFIGKSRNIKKKVNQLFTKDGERSRKIQKETKAATFEKTGNELIALLKENEELSKNKPKFNPRQKRVLFRYGIFQNTNEKGYATLRTAKYKSQKGCIGTFTSIHSAQNFLYTLTEKFQLCDKLNGLSETKSNCSKFDDELCLGACINKEETSEYNKRVAEVISRYSIENRNIIITDKGRETGESSAILIKNGALKGYVFYNLNHQINNISILESIITPMHWSKNVQHIIETYLRKNKRLKIIQF